MHPAKVPVYAVIRVDADAPASPASLERSGIATECYRDVPMRDVTVVFVVPTAEEAKREVKRLNDVKASPNSMYFWMTTRFYPQGRGSEPQEP